MKTILITCFILIAVNLGLAQETACACCTTEHSAFDFWLGTWEVSNPDGTPAGENTIIKSADNCIVYENWASAKAGYTGSSTNFYNKKSGQWEQLWIDNLGIHLKLKGKRVGNKMILVSEEFRNAKGVLNRNRITWTLNNDGTVRQLWEILEGDKAVNIAFDGLYRKRK